MTYQEKANEIIKESIKSAIFIDENARSFFQAKDELTKYDEEKLSVDLYDNFKNNGISLDVYKYNNGDNKKPDIKNYLFKNRDLVLLDWHLDGEEGEDQSLQLLADIVDRPNIHFCSIYTKEKDNGIDIIIKNILSYFSNNDKSYFDDLKEIIEGEEGIEKIKDDLDFINIHRDERESGVKIGGLLKDHKKLVEKIVAANNNCDKKCALINTSIALMDTFKSETPNQCPDLVSYENKTIIIDNTIITILNKTENQPDKLIEKLTNQIISGESSFVQLLGLEMQTILSKSSAFIDKNILQVSKEAFIHHRNNYREDKMEHLFPEFVKDIMLEKVNLALRGKNITLLDNKFLDSIDKKVPPKDKELISMNVFYNSINLKEDKSLNFGDVFIDENTKIYYICITALCDCLKPDKINNNFFFAKGTKITKDYALKLGDTAFISYIDSERIVKWTDVNKNIKEDEHQYSPVYIKPIPFTVIKPMIKGDRTISLSSLNEKGVTQSIAVKYLTTIKSNYTQRIANHAFAHPVRVGVDFVKR